MSQIREKVQDIIRSFDNESSFAILASTAMIPYLEEPLNRARFFDYDKQLELYFDSKDLNRFSRVKELTERIANRINVPKVTGFERNLKEFREKEIMIREKEGPSEGMAWKGFGGVHSHYDLTPLGKALLIFQTTLRCPAVNFRKLEFSENWDEFFKKEIFLITLGISTNKFKVKHRDNCFYTKRVEASYIAQLIFEFVAGAPKKISMEDIRSFIFDKAGEIHLGEIPGAIEKLQPLLQVSGEAIGLNSRGKHASCGYANVIIETALLFEDTEIVHYMITAKNLVEGSRKLLENYAHYF
ncbi:MAG: hypothetical protein FK732_10420 [Asgard group archaeon]|nr:hypothetical protein [Asgard group archaeon]